jgi:rRNA maturation endonuclease Nob1
VSRKRHRNVDEDWRGDPCHCCKMLVMLWWKFCPFCGTQLPTVLDGKVVRESRHGD